eukprot:14749526-Ditylum_brightwellii.AAC.1
MLEKTCTADNIIDGFVNDGMLGDYDKTWPCFYSILHMKQQSMTMKEMKFIEDHFALLYKIAMEQGHIPVHIYNELEFPKDKVDNNVIECNQGIEA